MPSFDTQVRGPGLPFRAIACYHLAMHVRIYQPSKSATQSGRGKTHHWLIEPERPTARTPETLMGWASAGDTLGELLGRLTFSTLEAAVAFAEKQGLAYTISQPGTRRIPPKNYLDNFRDKPSARTHSTIA